jgi:GNAT superfamily N-acetyltransferase
MTALVHKRQHGTSAWFVRSATVEDVPAINRLFADVFGRDRDDAATRWRLFHNPAGAPVVMIVEEADRIIAQRVFWPIVLSIGSTRVLGAQSIDLMVDVAYRGRGVFRALEVASFAMAELRGFELLYGFPNQNAMRASAQLGWNHIGDVPKFIRPLRKDAFRRLPTLLHPLAGLALRAWPQARCADFAVTTERPSDAELASLLPHRSAAADEICETARSAHWYDWRFSAQGEGRYEWVSLRVDGAVTAFAVWGRSHDGHDARLAEVVGTSPQAVSAAVASVIGRAREAGCSNLVAQTTRSDVLHALSVNGFRNDGPAAFRIRATSKKKYPLAESFPRWQLLGCDSDVY